MRIAITGASGFVGRGLCATLVRRGHAVVALARRPLASPGTGITPVTASLEDVPALANAMAGADAVVHLAARVHVMHEHAADPQRAFRQVNVEGTRAVLSAAAAAGVGRFVLLSSVKVHGEESERAYTEDAPFRPGDAYARSKVEAEELVASTWRGVDGWTVLRPPLVYGPGVAGNFRRLLRLADLAGRVPLPLGGLSNRRSLVGLGNLCDAIATCAAHPLAAGRAFLVADASPVSTSSLLEHLGRALRRPVRLLPCPEWLLVRFARLTGKGAEAARLLGSLAVETGRLRAQLGWFPARSLDEELSAVASWWRAFGAGGGA